MRERRRRSSKMLRRRKGGVGGGLMALKATGILTKDSESGGTNLVGACNGFNNLSRLAMLWTVHHR